MSGHEVPEGLHSMEYARHLIEFEMGWPTTRVNLELINECVVSLSKRRDSQEAWGFVKAYKYLARAITLARQQEIKVDRFFFEQGMYTSVRPMTEKKDHVTVSQERDRICESHGCMNGWVYADKGVKRCEKCRRVK